MKLTAKAVTSRAHYLTRYVCSRLTKGKRRVKLKVETPNLLSPGFYFQLIYDLFLALRTRQIFHESFERALREFAGLVIWIFHAERSFRTR